MIQKIVILVSGVFVLFTSYFVEQSRKSFVLEPHYLAPPENIEHLTFGYADPFADLLWLRTIQDLDYCDDKRGEGYCSDFSWVYKMFDATTRLAPQFRVVYAIGGPVLSVLIQDKMGAKSLLDKGVEQYPTDWPILYRAAYHYLYELDDKATAASLLARAAKQDGAPPWFYDLATRLFQDSGKAVFAQAMLNELKAAKAPEAIIKRLEKKLAAKSK
jgi:hypothetical protein